MNKTQSIVAGVMTTAATLFSPESNAQVALDQTSGNLYKTIVFANGTDTQSNSDSYTIVGPNNRNSLNSDVQWVISGVYAPGSTTPISFTSSTTTPSVKSSEQIGNTVINRDPTTVFKNTLTTVANTDGINLVFERTYGLADTNTDGQNDTQYTGREMISTNPIAVGTIISFRTPKINDAINSNTLLPFKTQFKIRNGTSRQETTVTPSWATNIGITPRINPTMGVDDIENKNHILLYPNPTTDFIQIKLPEEITEAHYEIYEINGRMMDYWEISSEEKINVQKLSEGIYIIQLTDKNNNRNTTTQKFIKK